MNDKSHYISELAHLFLCSQEGHIDTGAFMTRLAEILSDEKNKGKEPKFDVFLCTKENGGFNLHSHAEFNRNTIMECVFDLCGCRGFEVWRLLEGQHRGGFLFYEIWLYTTH